MSERQQYDGLGIAMLGLAVLMLVGVALTGHISAPKPNDDTSVQQSMAWASWAMVVVSTAGGVIGALSLYLIFRTLQAALRSAVAAENTVAISREIGMAQSRAYLSVEAGTLIAKETDFAFNVELDVRNAGQSPARNVRMETKVRFVELVPIDDDGGFGDSVLDSFDQERVLHDISASQVSKFRMMFTVLFREPSFDKMLQDVTYPICRVTVELRYEDVFGQVFTERSRFDRAISLSDNIKEGISLTRQPTMA